MEDLGKIFIAQFDSECEHCGEEVQEGDEARYSDGDVIGQGCCGWQIEEDNKEEADAWRSTS
jgi:formylmethanofuran dehydrogenase subunit E